MWFSCETQGAIAKAVGWSQQKLRTGCNAASFQSTHCATRCKGVSL
jgi:hypothetical protein